MSVKIFEYHAIEPFKIFGLTGSFWVFHLDILVATWCAMGLLFALFFLGKHFIKKDINPVGVVFEKLITFFIDLCKDSFHEFNYRYFAFIATLFFFTFFCCFIGIFPYFEEATSDINTTLALGVTSFLYVQGQKIKVHGILGFLKEFTQPFFILAPIHVIGELSKIASMSFRLFGNILGSGVILAMVIELLRQYKFIFLPFMACMMITTFIINKTGIITRYPFINKTNNVLLGALFLISWLQIFWGIFEGMIQSFVITMLTLTYLSIGTTHDDN